MDQQENMTPTKWKKRKTFRWGLIVFLGCFIFLNIIAAFQAYNFTHFQSNSKPNTLSENSSIGDKFKSIVFGVQISKPQNELIDLDFVEVDTVNGPVNLEVWKIDMEPSKGVVALFHGYKATKSTLWKEAMAFYRMGYTVVLCDFRAAGNSDGHVCTIGYYEANDVKSVFDYCTSTYPNQNIFLYGSSMGAASIMRAVSELKVTPKGILIQSPFYSMLSAVKTRFHLMGIPSFPSAHLITFWGGVLNNFNAYEHNPISYAEDIHCPTLLIHGMLDNRVSYEHAKEIYQVLPGKKEFGVFSKSGHESILNKEEPNWIYLVTNFMESYRH